MCFLHYSVSKGYHIFYIDSIKSLTDITSRNIFLRLQWKVLNAEIKFYFWITYCSMKIHHMVRWSLLTLIRSSWCRCIEIEFIKLKIDFKVQCQLPLFPTLWFNNRLFTQCTWMSNTRNNSLLAILQWYPMVLGSPIRLSYLFHGCVICFEFMNFYRVKLFRINYDIFAN